MKKIGLFAFAFFLLLPVFGAFPSAFAGNGQRAENASGWIPLTEEEGHRTYESVSWQEGDTAHFSLVFRATGLDLDRAELRLPDHFLETYGITASGVDSIRQVGEIATVRFHMTARDPKGVIAALKGSDSGVEIAFSKGGTPVTVLYLNRLNVWPDTEKNDRE